MKKFNRFAWKTGTFCGLLAAILLFATVSSEGVVFPQFLFCLAAAILLTIISFLPSFPQVLSKYILLLAPFASFYLMERFTHKPWEMEFLPQVVNLLFFYLITAGLWSLVKKSSRTLILSNIFFLMIGVANYYTSRFRGEPILPWDLQSIGTAISVTGNYSFTIDYPMLYVLFGFLAVFILGSKTTLTLQKSSLRMGLATASVLLIFTGNALLHIEGITNAILTPSNLFTQWATYRDNGFLVSFMVNLKYLNIDTPEDYSTAELEETMGAFLETDEPAAKPKAKNIIVIMNEAFSDLSVLHDFAVSEDPLPFIHSLQGSDNTIYGNLYMSVVGGNTANSEFEFLTNCTMAFLPAGSVPYQQYIKEELPNLTSQLVAQGFSSIALHPYYATGWNRNHVYDYLGFGASLFKPAFSNPEIIRKYVSDRSIYQKIIADYEEKTPGENRFFFTVTMQNHGGYSQSFDDFTSDVRLTQINNHPGTEQYLSLIRESDKSFEELVNYFKYADEETLILMFGDHQPSDYVTSVIQNQDGKTTDERTLEEQQLRYVTPFVMWANYDIEEAHYSHLSANYLNTLLLETAGIPLSPFQQYLDSLKDKLPVITANGIMDAAGTFYSLDETGAYEDILNEYSAFQYNLLFDDKHRKEEWFQ